MAGLTVASTMTRNLVSGDVTIQQERSFPKCLSTTHERLNSENGVHNPSNPNSTSRIKIYRAKSHCFKLVNLHIYFTESVI